MRVIFVAGHRRRGYHRLHDASRPVVPMVRVHYTDLSALPSRNLPRRSGSTAHAALGLLIGLLGKGFEPVEVKSFSEGGLDEQRSQYARR